MQPPNPPVPNYPIHPAMVTVANELHGFRLRSLGIVIGTAMREPNAFELWKKQRQLVLQSFEQVKQQAIVAMMVNARRLGANAVIAVRLEEMSMTGASTHLTGAQPTVVSA